MHEIRKLDPQQALLEVIPGEHDDGVNLMAHPAAGHTLPDLGIPTTRGSPLSL